MPRLLDTTLAAFASVILAGASIGTIAEVRAAPAEALAVSILMAEIA